MKTAAKTHKVNRSKTQLNVKEFLSRVESLGAIMQELDSMNDSVVRLIREYEGDTSEYYPSTRNVAQLALMIGRMKGIPKPLKLEAMCMLGEDI